jgi:hypothetical protein
MLLRALASCCRTVPICSPEDGNLVSPYQTTRHQSPQQHRRPQNSRIIWLLLFTAGRKLDTAFESKVGKINLHGGVLKDIK